MGCMCDMTCLDEELFSFGQNRNQTLGHAVFNNLSVPRAAAALNGVALQSVASNEYHSAAVDSTWLPHVPCLFASR
jgi:hypothetical protein